MRNFLRWRTRIESKESKEGEEKAHRTLGSVVGFLKRTRGSPYSERERTKYEHRMVGLNVEAWEKKPQALTP